jgi:hypothetical protein
MNLNLICMTDQIHYKCTVCLTLLPKSDFYRRSTQSGFRKECKKCYKLKKLFKRYQTLCKGCSRPSKLASNEKCPNCNKLLGLKACKQCGILRTCPLEFYRTRAICRWCLSKDQNKRKGPAPLISDSELPKLLENSRTYTIKELMGMYNCSLDTIVRAIKRAVR